MNKNNITPGNKLRNYSILAGSALATATSADGQIIYHNINPDTLLNTFLATYNLDLNGDGKSDISFVEFPEGSYDFASVKLQNKYASFEGFATVTSVRGLRGFPFVVNTGDKIGPGVRWAGYSSLLSNGHENYGNLAFYSRSRPAGRWGQGDTGKFVGLRLRSGTPYNYGWARITVTPGGKSITVLDYAYQSIPDSSIIAGDTGGCATGPIFIVAFNKNLRHGDTTRLKLFGDVEPGQMYDWFRGSEKIAITKYLHSIVVSEPGEYWAKVKASNGCEIVSDTVQVRDLSSPQPDELSTKIGEDLSGIYASDKVLHVNLDNSDYLQNSTIEIYNSAGEQVIRQNIFSQNFIMSLQPLASGIYFVKLTNGKTEINRKVFVE